MITPVYDRLIRRIRKTKSGCWEWMGATNNAGYGFIRDEPRFTCGMITVHRVMARHVGFDIENNEIQHKCLNKICVNPHHLTTGTVRDRSDRVLKKYGHKYMYPKKTYITCEHCNGTSYFAWFSRQHKDCYPGMLQSIHENLHKKHK